MGVRLLDAGHEVFRLKDHIPIESSDPFVIATAQRLDSILISLNGDFTDKLNYPPGNYKGIIALQVRNHPEIIPQLMVRLIDYLSSYPDTSRSRGDQAERIHPFYSKSMLVILPGSSAPQSGP